MALHGSWNRSRRVGYKLVFVPFKTGKPTSGPEDFLTGWVVSPDRSEVWGRPVGLLELADGSILVSDDGVFRTRRIAAVDRRRSAALVNAQHELAFRQRCVCDRGGHPEADPVVKSWRDAIHRLRGIS